MQKCSGPLLMFCRRLHRVWMSLNVLTKKFLKVWNKRKLSKIEFGFQCDQVDEITISSPNFFTSCPKSSHHISELLFVSKPRTFEKANLITLLALKFKNRLYRLCACDVDTFSDSYFKFFSKWSSQCKIAILNFIIFRTFDAWKDNKKHMFESQSQCQCLKKSTKLLKFSFKRIFNCGCQMWRGILNCTFYFFAQKVLF